MIVLNKFSITISSLLQLPNPIPVVRRQIIVLRHKFKYINCWPINLTLQFVAALQQHHRFRPEALLV